MTRHRNYRSGKINIEIGKGVHGCLYLYKAYAGLSRGLPELTHSEMIDEALAAWRKEKGVTHEEIVQWQLDFLMSLGAER